MAGQHCVCIQTASDASDANATLEDHRQENKCVAIQCTSIVRLTRVRSPRATYIQHDDKDEVWTTIEYRETLIATETCPGHINNQDKSGKMRTNDNLIWDTQRSFYSNDNIILTMVRWQKYFQLLIKIVQTYS